MDHSRHYEFEGIALEIPMHYDPLSHMYIEEYPDFVEHPIYTAEGYPVLFIGEDACPLSEAADGETCSDCGSCRYFRPAGPRTWIGVCGHEKRRRTPDEQGCQSG